MLKHVNSASRLYSILEEVMQQKGSSQVLDVWAKQFGIENSSATKKSRAVSERLGWMQRELESLRVQMIATSFSESLYAQALAHAEEALSTLLLPAQWNSVQQYLKPENFVSLNYCVEILPDEESQVSEEELEDIRAQVRSLAEMLVSSKLPVRLRMLVAHHIELINKALEEYPIAGAKALREAARTGLGEIIEVKEEIKANKDSPEIGKLESAWKRVNEVTDTALKAEKLSQLAQNAWAAIQNLI